MYTCISEDTFLYMYLIVVGLDDTSLRNAAHPMLLSYKSWRDLPDQSFSGCLCAFSVTCRCTSSSTDMVILGMSTNHSWKASYRELSRLSLGSLIWSHTCRFSRLFATDSGQGTCLLKHMLLLRIICSWFAPDLLLLYTWWAKYMLDERCNECSNGILCGAGRSAL